MTTALITERVALVSLRPPDDPSSEATDSPPAPTRGFSSRPVAGRGSLSSGKSGTGKAAKGRRKKGTGLSAADHGPLGRSPDIEAIQARARLGLSLAGRLRAEDVSQAWKQAAAEHHPDRGGRHDTMQAINAARDVLLGRGCP
jgi:hypothetical protein